MIKIKYPSFLSMKSLSVILCAFGIVLISSCAQYKNIEYPSDFEPLCEENDSCGFIYGTFKVDDKITIQRNLADGSSNRDLYPDLTVVHYLFNFLNLENDNPQWGDKKDVTKIEICGTKNESIYFIFHTKSNNKIKSKTIYANKDFKCKNGTVKFPELTERGKAADGPYCDKQKIQFFASKQGNLIALHKIKVSGLSQYGLYLPYVGASSKWFHLERIK